MLPDTASPVFFSTSVLVIPTQLFSMSVVCLRRNAWVWRPSANSLDASAPSALNSDITNCWRNTVLDDNTKKNANCNSVAASSITQYRRKIFVRLDQRIGLVGKNADARRWRHVRLERCTQILRLEVSAVRPRGLVCADLARQHLRRQDVILHQAGIPTLTRQ